jgi:hypothetical protein
MYAGVPCMNYTLRGSGMVKEQREIPGSNTGTQFPSGRIPEDDQRRKMRNLHRDPAEFRERETDVTMHRVNRVIIAGSENDDRYISVASYCHNRRST